MAVVVALLLTRSVDFIAVELEEPQENVVLKKNKKTVVMMTTICWAENKLLT